MAENVALNCERLQQEKFCLHVSRVGKDWIKQGCGWVSTALGACTEMYESSIQSVASLIHQSVGV